MTYPFIQAKHYTPGRDGKPIKLIVVHTMETPQTEGRAKQVALWFAGDNAPQASAHYMVDDKEVIQSVNEVDTAWAVNQQDINQQSISIEHAGYAAQTPQVWADTYATAQIALSGALTADLAHRYGIPLVRLTPAQILAGQSGLCGHVDITNAYKIAGGHTDPGVNFPWPAFLLAAKDAYAKITSQA